MRVGLLCFGLKSLGLRLLRQLDIFFLRQPVQDPRHEGLGIDPFKILVAGQDIIPVDADDPAGGKLRRVLAGILFDEARRYGEQKVSLFNAFLNPGIRVVAVVVAEEQWISFGQNGLAGAQRGVRNARPADPSAEGVR